jgi:hypothetical protein
MKLAFIAYTIIIPIRYAYCLSLHCLRSVAVAIQEPRIPQQDARIDTGANELVLIHRDAISNGKHAEWFTMHECCINASDRSVEYFVHPYRPIHEFVQDASVSTAIGDRAYRSKMAALLFRDAKQQSCRRVTWYRAPLSALYGIISKIKQARRVYYDRNEA